MGYRYFGSVSAIHVAHTCIEIQDDSESVAWVGAYLSCDLRWLAWPGRQGVDVDMEGCSGGVPVAKVGFCRFFLFTRNEQEMTCSNTLAIWVYKWVITGDMVTALRPRPARHRMCQSRSHMFCFKAREQG
jgi:hypothetical protein